MNPEQYLRLQEAFLELRELEATTQKQRLVELDHNDPEIACEVRQLLEADRGDRSFLEKPVVSHDQRIDIETQDMRPADADSASEMPSHIGPYRVLQKIGEGGHGVVFMAEQLQPIRRKVAIKWIKRGMDSDMILARFEAEWQALAMMKHPSIANVIEARSTESGQPYFVMELVHGVPIDDFCDQNRLTLTERLALFQQVCGAVHHAHQKGIIHRDIKPANVLITTDSGKPLAKVIDFGIAKALHMPLTEKTMFTEYGQIVGTLEYMSPEQALMSQTGIDVRSDVYSLGVLLYLLLTGETPVSRKELLRDGIWELKKVLQSTQPQTPSTRITSRSDPQRWRDHAASDTNWVRNVSGDLDWITMKAIARDPEFRYDSAADFSSDIDRYLEGDAIEARPPSRWYKFQKFVRKNQVAAVASSIVAISLLASLIVISFAYAKSQENLGELSAANESKLEALTELQKALDQSKEYSTALAKSVRRQNTEVAWDSALIGDIESATKAFDKIPEAVRGESWQLCKAIAHQYQLPVFRIGSESNIRTLAVDDSGHRIALINSASEAEIWDAASLKLLHTIELPTAIYTAASFSNVDTLLIGGPGNALVKVDLQTQTCRKVDGFPFGATRAIDFDEVNSCWWMTSDKTVFRISEQDLEVLSQIPISERIRPIAVASDGEQIAVGSLEGNVFVLDAGNPKQLRKIAGKGIRISQVGFTGGRLHAADDQGNVLDIRYKDIESGKLQQLSLVAKTPRQTIAGIFGSGSALLAAQRDGSVWLVEKNQQIPLRCFPDAVRKLAWLESVERLFSVHADGRISVLDRREIARRRNLAKLPRNVVDGEIAPNQKLGVTSHFDGTIRTWNGDTGSMMNEKKLHSIEPLELEVNPAGDMLASVALDKTMVLCSLPDLTLDRKIPVGWGVRTPAFSPDGKLVAGPAAANDSSNYREGTIDIWNVQTGKAVKRLAGHQNWVLKIRFINQRELISLSVDGTLRFWSIESGQCLQVINFAALGDASHFAFNGITGEVTLGHGDGVVSVWNRESGKLARSTVVGSGPIEGLTFLDQGQSILLVAVENSETLWLIDSKLQTVAQLNSGVGPLRAFRSQPNSLLLTGSFGLSKILKF